MQALCPSLSTGGLCLSPYFHIRLHVAEPGEEKNGIHLIELHSGVSDKMHVKLGTQRKVVFLPSSWVSLAKQFLRDYGCDTAAQLSRVCLLNSPALCGDRWY